MSINPKLTIQNSKLKEVFWYSTCTLVIDFLYLTVIKFRDIFFLFLFSLTVCFSVKGNSIEKGFEALKEYNYFEAKKIFYKTIKKDSSASSYGLATIFFRNDNPFHSLDSAYKYSCIAERTFVLISPKERLLLQKYDFEYIRIIELRAKVSGEYYQRALKINTIEGFDNFIQKNNWATERFHAIFKRDSIAFDNVHQKSTSAAVYEFMDKYPSSEFIRDAEKFLELCIYKETTVSGLLDSYIQFCNDNPRNRHVKDAEDKVFELFIKNKTLLEYSDFIKQFPYNRNIEIAWRKLYQLFMVDYTEDRIEQFQKDYPNYPFVSELEQDLKYAQRKIIPYKSNGLFGFMDYEGNSVIEPAYDYLGFYNEGLAVAVKNGKYGYIDKGNNVVIDFQYESGSDFENGRAIVGLNEKLGVINRAGFTVLPISFEDLGTFSEGLIYAKKDSMYGYYDNTGFQRLEERYKEAFSFTNGLAKVQIGNNQSFIDIYGTEIVAPLFETIHFFNDSLLVFEKDGKFGICRKNGTIIDSAKYDVIGTLINGRAIITQKGKLGYVNGEGKIILDIKYDEFPNFIEIGQFNGVYAVVRLKGKYGIIDNYGKFLILATYSQLSKFSSLIAFTKGKGWGFIDMTNNVVISPRFDFAESFNDGYASVEKASLVGLINPKDSITIPIAFTDIKRLDKQLVLVNLNNSHGVYDVTGKIIVPVEYEQIRLLNKEFLILTKASEVHYLYLPENKIIKPKVGDE